MREVKISRRKRSVGLSIKTEVFLDGQFVASVGDGETVSFEIDEEEHEIVVYNDKVSGNKINVNAGIEDVTLYLNYLFETFRLSNESDEEYSKDEFLDEKKFYNNNFTESPIKTYACAGIVTFLLVLFSLIMYLNENTTLIRFLISLVFSSAFCITMIVAGFWFIICIKKVSLCDTFLLLFFLHDCIN